MADQQAYLRRYLPQPLVALCISGLALLSLIGLRSIAPFGKGGTFGWRLSLLVVVLSCAVVVADRYPIHINYHTKASVSTIALYLMPVLLPIPVAGCAAGISKLVSEVLQREKGNLPSDIATCIGRWTIITVCSALVAHTLAQAGMEQTLVLLATGLVMFIGDLLTCGLELGPITGERPMRISRVAAQQVWRIDGVLYSLGVFAALAAGTHVWALVFLVPSLWTAYVAFQRTAQIQEGTRQLLESMADAVDLRDPYTGGHSRRVTNFCAIILRELGLKGPDVDLIMSAARVHDIGKIGIPDAILNKPGPLEPHERALMETHAPQGARLLTRSHDFARGAAIVRYHHERWDGCGYPDRKARYDIPLGARIMAVADSYDAMTSDRPYRPGMPAARAIEILRAGRGEQWDPVIVDAFLRGLATELDKRP